MLERTVKLFWRPVLWESIALTVICLLDAVLTIVVVLRGHAIEGNPYMAFFLHMGITSFVAVKVAYLIAGLIACEVLAVKKPQVARLVVRFAMFGYLLIYVVGSLRLNHML